MHGDAYSILGLNCYKTFELRCSRGCFRGCLGPKFQNFCFNSCMDLGYVVSALGVLVDLEKVEAVMSWERLNVNLRDT